MSEQAPEIEAPEEEEGIGWEQVEACGGRCEGGVCAGEAVCELPEELLREAQ